MSSTRMMGCFVCHAAPDVGQSNCCTARKKSLQEFAKQLSAGKHAHPVPQIQQFPNRLARSSKTRPASAQMEARGRQRATDALALDPTKIFRTVQCPCGDSEPLPSGGPYFSYFPVAIAKEKMRKDVSTYVECLVCRCAERSDLNWVMVWTRRRWLAQLSNRSLPPVLSMTKVRLTMSWLIDC